MKPIHQRILDARFRQLEAGEKIPNTLRLPPLEAALFADWLQHIEDDPFLGRTPIGERIYGMLIIEDPNVSEITARFEES